MEEPAPQKTVWTRLKAVPLATVLGAALTVAFYVLCRYDNTAIRWWLMLPIATLGGGLLLWRRKRAPGAESQFCTVFLCLLLALLVLRDIGLSRKLAGLFDQMQHYKAQVNGVSDALDHFFGGGR